MASNDEVRRRCFESLDQFLTADSTTNRDIDLILKSMGARPTMGAIRSPLPIDEMEERLRLVAEYQDLLWAAENSQSDEDRHTSGLTTFELSVLMALPLERLRNVESVVEGPPHFASCQEVVRMGMSCFLVKQDC